MEENYIVIPALEPGHKFLGYIRELLEKTGAEVIVVDDGSGPAYRHLFDRIGAMEGCTVLRHEKNRGKGRALKTAFSYIKARSEEGAGRADRDEACRDGHPCEGGHPCEDGQPFGDRKPRAGILCTDCDGQHAAEDGARLLRLAGQHPGSLILGVRDFSESHVPWKSRLGNRIASRAMKAASGLSIRDTQTGLRAFDSSLLDFLTDIPGERFDYETQMLLACAGRRIPVYTADIRTVYEEANAGTHFRPVRDSISVLSAFLRRPLFFLASSVFCALLDVLAFVLIDRLLRSAGETGNDGPAGLSGTEAGIRIPGSAGVRIFAATAGARLLSAAANYLINRFLVFGVKRNGGRHAARYALLCAGIAAASALSVTTVSALTGIRPEGVKVPCDGALFLASYQIQKRWVFRKDPGGEESAEGEGRAGGEGGRG